MEYRAFYCPGEKAPRSFKRVDNGLPIIGEYECESCETKLPEYQLHSDGLVGAIRDNVRRMRNGR